MLDLNNLPTHVALIMDGNGRWATKRGVPRLAGHNAGMNALVEIVRHASHIGIKHITVYAFSTENWKRSVEEVNGIFAILVKFVDMKLAELHREHVRVRILGDYRALPEKAANKLEGMAEKTKDNDGLQLNICVNYGSRDEIVRAVRNIAEKVKAGDIDPQEISADTFSAALYTGEEGVPDPDLIIRTSGEERLSNYLLWQAAYSEMVFPKTLWPDFTPEEFDSIIEEFQGRDRRFGGRNK